MSFLFEDPSSLRMLWKNKGALYLKCSIFCWSLDGFFRLICYLMCLTSVLTLGRTIAVDQGHALKPKVETVKVGKLVERRTIYKVSFSNQQWTYKFATINEQSLIFQNWHQRQLLMPFGKTDYQNPGNFKFWIIW